MGRWGEAIEEGGTGGKGKGAARCKLEMVLQGGSGHGVYLLGVLMFYLPEV